MSRKILLVDDNLFNRKYMRDLLAITGLEVIEAMSCQQGVEIAISQHPGLILLASGMSCLRDSEAFAILQKFPSTSKIPVLPVSSRDAEDASNYCVPATSLFRRPVPIQALVQKIRPYVNAARSMVNRTMIWKEQTEKVKRIRRNFSGFSYRSRFSFLQKPPELIQSRWKTPLIAAIASVCCKRMVSAAANR